MVVIILIITIILIADSCFKKFDFYARLVRRAEVSPGK